MSDSNLVSRLLTAINSKRPRVVVIGDTMIDRWVSGQIEPCQDDCPKFVHKWVNEVPGGAGNAARSIEQWKVNISLYGYAENDCPVKTRFVNSDNNMLVMRYDNDGPATRGEGYEWARRNALEMVRAGRTEAVLLSDYDKGFLTPGFIQEVVAVCTARHIPCVADCKRAPETYSGCVLKGNNDYWWKHSSDLKAPRWGVRTMGCNAPIVHTDGYSLEVAELPLVRCVNHVGAGDCFAAHLTLCLACGFTLNEAATLAHSAGRVYVQYPLNRPPHPTEILADLATQLVEA